MSRSRLHNELRIPRPQIFSRHAQNVAASIMLPWLMQSLVSCPPLDFPVEVHRPTTSAATPSGALPVDDEGRAFLPLPRQWAVLEWSGERLVHDNRSRTECDARDHVFGLSRAAVQAMFHELQKHRCDCAFREYVDASRRSGYPEIDDRMRRVAIAAAGSGVVGHPTASHPLAAETASGAALRETGPTGASIPVCETPAGTTGVERAYEPVGHRYARCILDMPPPPAGLLRRQDSSLGDQAVARDWLEQYGAVMGLPQIGGGGGGNSLYRRRIAAWALGAAAVAVLAHVLYLWSRTTRLCKQ